MSLNRILRRLVQQREIRSERTSSRQMIYGVQQVGCYAASRNVIPT